MFRDRMQKQRFELKYFISEHTALLVRDFVGSYLDFDEYSLGKPNYSYPVHSIYLDSEDLITYRETINGTKNRYKLRLRFYSEHPQAPVFFEIKRRMNNVIMKQRGGVQQEAVPDLLAGHVPRMEHLVSQSSSQLFALQKFCELMQHLIARPKIHIAYMREAYVSDDDAVRVTMDRTVVAERYHGPQVKTHMTHPVQSFLDGDLSVILELKYTNRFPSWFNELVRTFHVMQCGAAKYVESILSIGPDKFMLADTASHMTPQRGVAYED